MDQIQRQNFQNKRLEQEVYNFLYFTNTTVIYRKKDKWEECKMEEILL